eukprot:580922-Amorphochlora_amoeboformis.AAC.3
MESESGPGCEFDVGNLVCYDPTALKVEGDGPEHDIMGILLAVYVRDMEALIMERARSNVEQLLGKIFALPTEDAPYGNGKVVTLPEPTTKLPREKPSFYCAYIVTPTTGSGINRGFKGLGGVGPEIFAGGWDAFGTGLWVGFSIGYEWGQRVQGGG